MRGDPRQRPVGQALLVCAALCLLAMLALSALTALGR